MQFFPISYLFSLFSTSLRIFVSPMAPRSWPFRDRVRVFAMCSSIPSLETTLPPVSITETYRWEERDRSTSLFVFCVSLSMRYSLFLSLCYHFLPMCLLTAHLSQSIALSESFSLSLSLYSVRISSRLSFPFPNLSLSLIFSDLGPSKERELWEKHSGGASGSRLGHRLASRGLGCHRVRRQRQSDKGNSRETDRVKRNKRESKREQIDSPNEANREKKRHLLHPSLFFFLFVLRFGIFSDRESRFTAFRPSPLLAVSNGDRETSNEQETEKERGRNKRTQTQRRQRNSFLLYRNKFFLF